MYKMGKITPYRQGSEINRIDTTDSWAYFGTVYFLSNDGKDREELIGTGIKIPSVFDGKREFKSDRSLSEK